MKAFAVFIVLAGTASAQLPITQGLELWLKSDAGVVTSGGRVDSWTDQSPNGHVFTATGGQRPHFGGFPTVTQPTVRFTGAEQLDGNLGRTLTAATVFTLAKYTVASSNNDYLYAIGTPAGSGSQMCASRRNTDRAYHFDGRLENIAVAGTPAIQAETWHVHSQQFQGTAPDAHKWWIDGARALTTNALNSYAADASTFVIGNWTSGSNCFVGEMVEMIVFDRAVTNSERIAVEAYLQTRAQVFGQLTARFLDLSQWSVVQYEMNAQPDANWILGNQNRTVNQSVNSDPSIYLSNFDVTNKVIRGALGAGTAPDYIGFVFGYQDRGHYYLFDWKRVTASYQNFGVGQADMTLRIIDVQGGGDPTGADLWGSAPTPNTFELRNTPIPWGQGVDYDFELRFEPGQFEILVLDGGTVVENWTVQDSTYQNGYFGYYVNSCQNVRFGRVLAEALQTGQPCGPTLTADALIAGEPWTVSITGGTPANAGTLFFSIPPAAAVPLPGGCSVELDLASFQPLLPVTLDMSGSWSLTIPIIDPALTATPQTLALQALLGPAPTPIALDLSNGLLITTP